MADISDLPIPRSNEDRIQLAIVAELRDLRAELKAAREPVAKPLLVQEVTGEPIPPEVENYSLPDAGRVAMPKEMRRKGNK